MSESIDVIVIGAGIAGSSCALQLARQGHCTLLLDRQSFPRHKTCGEFMSPETKEMLEYLNIQLQEVEPSTMDHAQIIMPQGGQIEAPLPGSAYGISRHELDRLLHKQAQAAGAEIITKATIVGIQLLEDECYEVQVKQGNEQLSYRTKAVIGAYGTKKPRGMTSPPETRDDTVYVGIKSHYSGLDMPARVELYFCEGGYVGISPIENGYANVAALLTLDTVQGSGKSVTDILQAASETNGRLAARLEAGKPVQGTQVSIAPLHLSNVPEPWSQFPHIGDAMLMIPPLCGDGMSIALRSSILCAEWTHRYLQKDIGFAEWKEGYMKDASEEFTELLRRARRIQKLAFAKTNKYYPALARVFPGLAAYLVKATRLSEMNAARG